MSGGPGYMIERELASGDPRKALTLAVSALVEQLEVLIVRSDSISAQVEQLLTSVGTLAELLAHPQVSVEHSCAAQAIHDDGT